MLRILFIIFAVCIILHSKVLKAEETIFPGAFWEECSPEEQKVDSKSLDEAMQYLGNFIYAKEKVKRALVIRNGYVIWKGADIDSVNCVFSVTKAFASTILGHLIDNGKCSLETLAKDCVSLDLSNYPNVNLFHLSTMTSGYDSEGRTWIKNGIGGLRKKRLWSNAPPNTYAAVGAHHNWCWVIPKWNMIIVRIGMDNPRYLGNFDKRYDTFFLKLSQSIINENDK